MSSPMSTLTHTRTINSSIALLLIAALTACGDDDDDGTDSAASTGESPPTLRADVQAVRSAADALPNVFIPPFVDCREPLAGEAGMGPDGQVCTNVAISGCTEPGKYFPDYAECDVVRTQRPYWPAPPAAEPKADDPRLDDAAFMDELAWVTEQVGASGCACCHDGSAHPAAQWDISRGPIWVDTLSDTGLALFVGLADSSVLGAYPAEDNYGFDRTATGIPTTDTERMQAFLRAELERRGISEEEARAVPPFGGPIYANSVAVPEPCGAGEGVDPDGVVHWNGGDARYVYVGREDARNPGVPPNLDLPKGTLWRLDALASEPALDGPLEYGETPKGSFQAVPEKDRAPALERGRSYLLTVLRDVGLPLASCVFEFGEDVAPAKPSQEPASDAGPACELPDNGFGAACTDAVEHSECSCAADYCAVMPGQSEGYCTVTGCKDDPSVCPEDWSCFDLSAFQSGAPAICLAP
jgi:hypothetical protein